MKKNAKRGGKILAERVHSMRKKASLAPKGIPFFLIAAVLLPVVYFFSEHLWFLQGYEEITMYVLAAIWAIGALLILIGVLFRAIVKSFIKKHYIRQLFMERFQDVEFDSQGFIDAGLLREGDLHSGWTAAKGSDLITAKFEGKTFSFSNVELYNEVKLPGADSKGNATLTSKEIPIFKGQWVVIDKPLSELDEEYNQSGYKESIGSKQRSRRAGGKVHIAWENREKLFTFTAKEARDIDGLVYKIGKQMEQLIKVLKLN